MQIEDYLYPKDLHESLTGVKPKSMTEEKWKLMDRQALGLIRLTLSRNVAFNIVKEKTTSDLLKALSNIYENIDYEQGIFDAYIVQFIDVSNWIRL